MAIILIFFSFNLYFAVINSFCCLDSIDFLSLFGPVLSYNNLDHFVLYTFFVFMELLVYLHFKEGILDLCQMAISISLWVILYSLCPIGPPSPALHPPYSKLDRTFLATELSTLFPVALSCFTSSRSSDNFLSKGVSWLCCYVCILHCYVCVLCYVFVIHLLWIYIFPPSLPSLFLFVFLPYILMVAQEEEIKAYAHLQSWSRGFKKKIQTYSRVVKLVQKIPKCPLLIFPKC